MQSSWSVKILEYPRPLALQSPFYTVCLPTGYSKGPFLHLDDQGSHCGSVLNLQLRHRLYLALLETYEVKNK
ncbi:hypothetical protein D3C81_1449650 [compost metagenome]